MRNMFVNAFDVIVALVLAGVIVVSFVLYFGTTPKERAACQQYESDKSQVSCIYKTALALN